MIKAYLQSTGAEAMTDFLGGDAVAMGELRSGEYPSAEVVFYDSETEQRYAGKIYVLRPRSAFDSATAIADDVELTKQIIATEQDTTPTDDSILQELTDWEDSL